MNVILMMAQSLDGMIARHSEHFPDWTGKADKRLFVEVTRRAGVMIMGRKTFDTLGEPLPGRHHVVMTRSPSRTSPWPNLEYTDASPPAIVEGLERKGYREAVLTGGAMVNGLFAQAGCIDEVMVTVVPTVFGKGIPLFGVDLALDLALVDHRCIGEDRILLHYRVRKGA